MATSPKSGFIGPDPVISDPSVEAAAPFVSSDPPIGSSDASGYPDYVPFQAPPVSSGPGLLQTSADVGKAIVKGFANVYTTTGQLAAMAGRKTGLGGLERAGESLRQFGQEKEDILVNPALGGTGLLGAMAPENANPKSFGRKALFTVAESAPSMVSALIPGAGAAAGLRAVGLAAKASKIVPIATAGSMLLKKAPTIAGAFAEGTQAGAQNAAQARDEIGRMPIESLAKHPRFQAELAKTDSALPMEERQRIAREAVSRTVENEVMKKTAPWTGGVSLLTGAGVIGQLLEKPIMGIMKNAFKGLTRETIQEFFQSGGEYVFQEQAAKEGYDQSRGPTVAGTAEAAALGAVAGAVMGGLGGTAKGLEVRHNFNTLVSEGLDPQRAEQLATAEHQSVPTYAIARKVGMDRVMAFQAAMAPTVDERQAVFSQHARNLNDETRRTVYAMAVKNVDNPDLELSPEEAFRISMSEDPVGELNKATGIKAKDVAAKIRSRATAPEDVPAEDIDARNEFDRLRQENEAAGRPYAGGNMQPPAPRQTRRVTTVPGQGEVDVDAEREAASADLAAKLERQVDPDAAENLERLVQEAMKPSTEAPNGRNRYLAQKTVAAMSKPSRREMLVSIRRSENPNFVVPEPALGKAVPDSVREEAASHGLLVTALPDGIPAQRAPAGFVPVQSVPAETGIQAHQIAQERPQDATGAVQGAEGATGRTEGEAHDVAQGAPSAGIPGGLSPREQETNSGPSPATTSKPPELMTPEEFRAINLAMNSGEPLDVKRFAQAMRNGLPMRKGYVRDGDRYVFNPSPDASTASAASETSKRSTDNTPPGRGGVGEVVSTADQLHRGEPVTFPKGSNAIIAKTAKGTVRVLKADADTLTGAGPFTSVRFVSVKNDTKGRTDWYTAKTVEPVGPSKVAALKGGKKAVSSPESTPRTRESTVAPAEAPVDKAQREPDWRDGGTLSRNADGMWEMSDGTINPQPTAKEAAASIVEVEPTSHVAIRRVKGTDTFKVQVAEWDADEPSASNPRILDFRDVESTTAPAARSNVAPEPTGSPAEPSTPVEAAETQVEGRPTAPVTPATPPAESSVNAWDASTAFFKKAQREPVTAAEAQAVYARMKAEKDAALAALMAKINADPKLARKRQKTKQEIAERTYTSRLQRFATLATGGFQWIPHQETIEQAADRHVAELTDEAIRKEWERTSAQSDANRKAIENPETLDEFRTFLAFKGESALSADQRAKWDALRAEIGMQAREEQAIEKKGTVGQVEGAAQVPMEIVERPHEKRGHNVFIVTMGERVGADTFKELAQKARRLGGNYSRAWKPTDSPAGFVFNDRASAEKFMSLREGDVSKAEDVAAAKEETREAAADRLTAMADKMESDGNDSLGRDRLANTARRARMANAAEDDAAAKVAMARTIRNIAAAVRDGRAKFLKNVKTRTQIETLARLVDATREWDPEHKGHGYGPVRVEQSKYPTPQLWGDHIAGLIRDIQSKPGGKMLALRLGKYVGQREGMTDIPRDIAAALLAKFPKESGMHNLERTLGDLKRLEGMNITNDAELRSALREYLDYKGAAPAENTAARLRREIVGQSVGVDYFPTPPTLAADVVRKADIRSGMTVLEPSAGDGQLANQVRAQHPEAPVAVIEMSSKLREILTAEGHNLVGSDFMDYTGPQVDRIVMNPPFSDNQDIRHVRKAFDLLNPGGRVVAIMSEHAFFGKEKEAQEFRDWLDENGGTSEQNPEGSFLEGRTGPTTGVATRTVVIDKPAEKQAGRDATEESLRAEYHKARERGDQIAAHVLKRALTERRTGEAAAKPQPTSTVTIPVSTESVANLKRAGVTEQGQEAKPELSNREIIEAIERKAGVLVATGNKTDADNLRRDASRFQSDRTMLENTLATATQLADSAKKRRFDDGKTTTVQPEKPRPIITPETVALQSRLNSRESRLRQKYGNDLFDVLAKESADLSHEDWLDMTRMILEGEKIGDAMPDMRDREGVENTVKAYLDLRDEINAERERRGDIFKAQNIPKGPSGEEQVEKWAADNMPAGMASAVDAAGIAPDNPVLGTIETKDGDTRDVYLVAGIISYRGDRRVHPSAPGRLVYQDWGEAKDGTPEAWLVEIENADDVKWVSPDAKLIGEGEFDQVASRQEKSESEQQEADAERQRKISAILDAADQQQRNLHTPVERSGHWVSLTRDGTTVGKQYPTEAAWREALEQRVAAQRKEFGGELARMNDARIQSQYDYWVKKPAPAQPAATIPPKAAEFQEKARASASAKSAGSVIPPGIPTVEQARAALDAALNRSRELEADAREKEIAARTYDKENGILMTRAARRGYSRVSAGAFKQGVKKEKRDEYTRLKTLWDEAAAALNNHNSEVRQPAERAFERANYAKVAADAQAPEVSRLAALASLIGRGDGNDPIQSGVLRLQAEEAGKALARELVPDATDSELAQLARSVARHADFEARTGNTLTIERLREVARMDPELRVQDIRFSRVKQALKDAGLEQTTSRDEARARRNPLEGYVSDEFNTERDRMFEYHERTGPEVEAFIARVPDEATAAQKKLDAAERKAKKEAEAAARKQAEEDAKPVEQAPEGATFNLPKLSKKQADADAMLNEGLKGKRTLPILNSIAVSKGRARATDLEVEVDVPSTLADGVYTRPKGTKTFIKSTDTLDEFPVPQKLEGDRHDVALTAEQARAFREALAHVEAAASTDATRYMLNSVAIHIRDGAMTLVATDGRRLHTATIPGKVKAPDMEIVLSTRAVAVLRRSNGQGALKISVAGETIEAGKKWKDQIEQAEEHVAIAKKNLKADDPDTARYLEQAEARLFDLQKAAQSKSAYLIHKPLAIITDGDTVIRTKLIEGTYPNYRQVIPPEDGQTLRVEVDRKALGQALNDLAPFLQADPEAPSQGWSDTVRVRIAKDGITFTAANGRKQYHRQKTIPVSRVVKAGEPVETAFNMDFLRDQIAGSDAPTAVLGVTDELSPLTVSDPDGRRMGVLMPMRVSARSEAQAPTLPPLVAMHNLSADNLAFAEEMGGLAMPSLGIGSATSPYEGFGDITLIGRPELVDPKVDRSMRVANADQYSPRYPSATHMLAKGVDAVWKPIEAWVKATYGDLRSETIKKEDSHIRSVLYGLHSHLEAAGQFRDHGLTDLYRDMGLGAYFAGTRLGRVFRDTNTIDGREALRSFLNEHKAEFEAWVNETFDPFVERKIFKGFTNAGNKRYAPYTLDYVMKELRKAIRSKEGEGFFYGAGSVRAAIGSKQYRTLDQIKADRDKLKAGMDEDKQGANNRLVEIADMGKSAYSQNADTFSYSETFWNAVIDALRSRSPRAKLAEYGFDYDKMPWAEIREFTDELKAMPTEYFEAKPQRVVQLQEFTGAVVPNNASQKTLDILKRHGIEVETYDPNKEGDRARAVDALSFRQNVQFSRDTLPLRTPLSRDTFETVLSDATRMVPFAAENVTAGLSTDEDADSAFWRMLDDSGRGQAAADARKWFGEGPVEWWHGTASQDLRGGVNGLHLGTHEAAKQALEATIGIRADGKDWDGSTEYGDTLLMGRNNQRKMRETQPYFGGTGFNAGTQGQDIPAEDFYARDLPDTLRARYSNREMIPLTVKPAMLRMKIVGPMSNNPWAAMTDARANGTMRGLLNRGAARKGYYYENIGEDSGSISAVVPSERHVVRFHRSRNGQVRAITYGNRSHFFLDRYENASQLRGDIMEEAGHRLVNELGGEVWRRIGFLTYRGRWTAIRDEIQRNYGFEPGTPEFNHELIAKAFRDGKHNVGLLRRFMDAAVSAFRALARRLGFDVTMSDAEVRNALRGMLEAKARGANPATVAHRAQAAQTFRSSPDIRYARGEAPDAMTPEELAFAAGAEGGQRIEAMASKAEYATKTAALKAKLATKLASSVKAEKEKGAARLAKQAGTIGEMLREYDGGKAANDIAEGRLRIRSIAQRLVNANLDEQRKLRKELIAAVKKNVPTARARDVLARNILAAMVSRRIDQNRMDAALRQIDQIMDKQQRSALITAIKSVYAKAVDSMAVNVSYRQRIRDLMDGFLMSKPTQATLDKARELADFLAAEVASGSGMDLTPNRRMARLLGTLSKVPLSELDVGQLQDVFTELSMLVAHGKLYQEGKRKQELDQQEADIAELVAQGTRRLDEPVKDIGVIGEPPTFRKRFVDAMAAAGDGLRKWYVWHLPTDRLFDLLDGYRHYRGGIYRMFKGRVNAAFKGYRSDLFPVEQELKEMLKAHGINKREAIRIGVYGVDQQTMEGDPKYGRSKLYNTFGAETKAQQDEIDRQVDAIQLTPDERAVYEWMLKKFDEVAPQLQRTANDVYNVEFDKVSKYWPMQTDWEIMDNDPVAGYEFDVNGQLMRKNPKKGMIEARTGAGKQRVQIDAARGFLKHMSDAYYLIHMAPATRYMSELARREEMRSLVGSEGQRLLLEFTDTMARKGGVGGDHVIRWADTLRRNVGVGTLGFRITSAFIQPTSFVNAIGLLGPRAFKGAYELTLPGRLKWILDNSTEIRDRVGDDPSFTEWGGSRFAQNAVNYGYWALERLDRLTAAAVFVSAYEENLKSRGMVPDYNAPADPEAVTHAENIVRLTQASGSYKDVPMGVSRGKILKSHSLSKMLYQFQTFSMNTFAYMAHDGIGNAMQNKEFGRAFNMVLWTTMAFMAEEGIRAGIASVIGGGGGDDDMLKEIVWDYLGTIPVFGQLVGSMRYNSVPIPLVATIGKAATGVRTAMTGAEPETRGRGAIRSAGAMATLAGVPGSSQAADLFSRGLKSDKETLSVLITDSAKRLPVTASAGRIALEAQRTYNRARSQGLVDPRKTTPAEFRSRYKSAFTRINNP